MNHQVFVEFLGPAGVGKSHLAYLLLDRMRDEEITASMPLALSCIETHRWRRVLAKAFFAANSVLMHPLAAARSLRAISGSSQSRKRDAISLWMNWLFLDHIHTRSDADAVVMLDQGFLQLHWSVYLLATRGNPGRTFSALVGHRVPQIIVVVEASEIIIRERLASRPGRNSRFEKENAPTSQLSTERGNALFSEIIAGAQHAAGSEVEVVRVRNDQPESTEAALRSILSVIRSTLRK